MMELGGDVGGQDHGTSSPEFSSNSNTERKSEQVTSNPHDEAFALRKLLGTGDATPAPKGKRARHLSVGEKYHNITFNETCIIQEINEDGDVQITFPNSTNEDPTTLYTADQGEIEALRDGTDTTEAKRAKTMPPQYPLVESSDGTIFSSGEFTAELLKPQRPTRQGEPNRHSTHEEDPDPDMNRDALRMATHATTLLRNRVDKAPAYHTPRTHYEIGNSILQPMIEAAQHQALGLLITQGVFHHAHTRLATDLVLPTIFVHSAKGYEDGMLISIKARLTLRGDINKKELVTHAPPFSSIRFLLALHCNDPDTQFMQMNYEATLVTTQTSRRTVVSLPTGLIGPGVQVPDPVHVLNVELYDSTESAVRDHYDMVTKLKNLGFNSVPSDPSYFEILHDHDFIKIILHRDDLLIAYRGTSRWQWYLDAMDPLYRFTVAPLTHLLGIRFERQADGHFLINQETQVDKMCLAFQLIQRHATRRDHPALAYAESDRPKPTDYPLSPEDQTTARQFPYREAIGHLNYLTQTTHFEFALPVCVASDFYHDWGNKQWIWVKQIMRNVQSRITAFTYIRGGGSEHSAWSSTDGGGPRNQRSMSAYLSYYGNDLLDWHVGPARDIAHTGVEAELMALDAIARHTNNTRWKLTDFGHPPTGPSIIHLDSASAIQMVTSRRNKQTSRLHIPTRYFYVRSPILDRSIVLRKTTELNRADLLITYQDSDDMQVLLKQCKPQPQDEEDESPPAPTAVDQQASA